MPRTMSALGSTLVMTGLVGGCGAGSVARPTETTYASAAGANPAEPAVCHDVAAEGSPLIVDWKPEDRTDLEVAMKRGVAVVHYDCHTLKIVNDCNPGGVYGYIGVSKKEQVIRLADADEAKANLPLNGGALGASLARGSTLDIALLMVGKKSTTSTTLAVTELDPGKCKGATHFVRAATIGAFAMKTGTIGQVQGAAELFGFGASSSSASGKSMANRDGDNRACEAAESDSPTPPHNCQAVLRVQLVALASKSEAGASPVTAKCPAGLVPDNGKCAAPKDENDKRCHTGDIKACAALCDRGVIDPCETLAGKLMGIATREKSRAYDVAISAALRRACDAGRTESCGLLGMNYVGGLGVPVDPVKGRAMVAQSCDAGDALGCTILGSMYLTGKGVPVDKRRALALVDRGCKAGDGLACQEAGQLYGGVYGTDVPTDKAKSVDYYARACDAKESWGCVNAGITYQRGDGIAPNPSLAASFFDRGCRAGNEDACARAKGKK